MPHLIGILTQNLGLKLLALLLAFTVYAHVATEQEQEWQIRAPLKVTGLAGTLVVDQPPPASVELSVRGKGKQLLRLRVSPPQMILDLSRVGPGRIQRILSPADVALPVGAEVAVTEVRAPNMVTLTVDTLVVLELEVVLPVVGNVPEGLALLGEIRADPPRVRVTLPSRLAGRVELGVEPFDLRDLARRAEVKLRVEANLEGVAVEPPEVGVAAEVVRVVDRKLPPVPVRVERLAGGLFAQVEPGRVEVTVSGPEPLVTGLVPDSLRVTLDLDEQAPGRHLLNPRVRLPGSLRVASIHPPRILVEIFPDSTRGP